MWELEAKGGGGPPMLEAQEQCRPLNVINSILETQYIP